MTMRRARPLLGTLFEISVESDVLDAEAGGPAFEAAFQAAERVHRLMSAHDPVSDVSRINRARPGERVVIDPWTHRVLASACEFARSSAGLFDPCVAPLLQDAGFLPRFGAPQTRDWGDYRDLELQEGCAVRMRRPLQITLDGIAKGFAVDRAIAALKRAGAVGGVVNAGGDLRVFGRQAHPIHVRDPAAPGRLVFVGHLREAALATSAAYFSRRHHEGRCTSHIFHPHKAAAFTDDLAASVVARDCMTADALAKAALLDATRITPVLERHQAQAHFLGPGGVAA